MNILKKYMVLIPVLCLVMTVSTAAIAEDAKPTSPAPGTTVSSGSYTYKSGSGQFDFPVDCELVETENCTITEIKDKDGKVEKKRVVPTDITKRWKIKYKNFKGKLVKPVDVRKVGEAKKEKKN